MSGSPYSRSHLSFPSYLGDVRLWPKADIRTESKSPFLNVRFGEKSGHTALRPAHNRQRKPPSRRRFRSFPSQLKRNSGARSIQGPRSPLITRVRIKTMDARLRDKRDYPSYTQARKQGCHPFCLQAVEATARKGIGKSLLEAENGEMQ